MRRLQPLVVIFLVATAFTAACGPRPVAATVPRLPPEIVAARLADVDRIAGRGCYLCLKEAQAAYDALLADSDDPAVAAKALENNLMIALREVELRIPGSGAGEAAARLHPRVRQSYADYVFLAGSRPSGSWTLMASEFEKAWPASGMKGYFYLAAWLGVGILKEQRPQVEAVRLTHANDLAVQYRLLSYQPLWSRDAANELIRRESGFAEVHYLLGQAAARGGNMADAYCELSRAREMLPDSALITMALANVKLAYARYAEALALYDAVLAAWPEDEPANMGRAKALSYLRRHDEAVVLLTHLLSDPRANPYEKYYWRAWNRLQLAQAQPAYEDALTALNGIRNDAVYRLAGMAAFALNKLDEARAHFTGALQMNAADCDAERYLGQIDTVERSWKAGFARFTQAVGCYDAAIAGFREELAGYEKDITGLSNGLIAAKRGEIKDAENLRAHVEKAVKALAERAGP